MRGFKLHRTVVVRQNTVGTTFRRPIRDLLKTQNILSKERTAHGQNPPYVVLSCADSRTPPELIFNQGLGSIFCPRVAGKYCRRSSNR